MQKKPLHDIYLLGIDVGTTVSKSVVVDPDGREVAIARCPTVTQHPIPSGSEADMLDVWRAVKKTIRELLFEQGIPADAIKAIRC